MTSEERLQEVIIAQKTHIDDLRMVIEHQHKIQDTTIANIAREHHRLVDLMATTRIISKETP